MPPLLASVGRRLDRAIRRATDLVVAWDVGAPAQRRLDRSRRRVVERILGEEQANIADVEDRLRRADPDAHDRLGALAERLLATARHRLSSEVAGPMRVAERLDAAFPTRRGELLDDPSLDPVMRRRLIADLDRLNRVLGSYERFLALLGPWLATDRPTRILDLAAGHGGFDLDLARLARQRGLRLEITASDLKEEYLDLGRREAEREGLEVRFVVQDALDLRNLREPDAPRFDVITCTQSLHHFPVGLLAVMLHEAAATAERGVLFIDGYRSLSTMVAVSALCALRFRNPGLVHDGWVSSRRFFVPEELQLVAAVTPARARATAFRIPPAFCVLRVEN